MSTTNLFTNSAPTQSYTAVNSGMDGAQQSEGETLFQQASQSRQPDVLVKRQFEQRNQSQKSKLANEFIASVGREGISKLAATPDGQHALAVVYDHAGSDGRGMMRQVHEEQGNTAVDYTPERELVCTKQSVQEAERTPEEQYLNKLMKQYAEHKSGEMPLPPSESLNLRSEIERVSNIVNPGQQNMWGEYTPKEKQYLEDQALKERKAKNNLGMLFSGPVFSAMPALARLLDAPESVVEGFGQINAQIVGGKAFGRQGRGIEPVRTPVNSGPAKAYVIDKKSVSIEQSGLQGIASNRNLNVPQGMTKEQFAEFSHSLQSVIKAENLPQGKVVVHGSRAKGTAMEGRSDIDVLLVVGDKEFGAFSAKRLAETSGGNRKKILQTINNQQRIRGRGISQTFETNLWKQVVPTLPDNVTKVQFSIVTEGSKFNQGPFIPLN